MNAREQMERNVAASDYIDKFAARRERIGGTLDVSTKDLMLDTYLEGWAACHRYYSAQSLVNEGAKQ